MLKLGQDWGWILTHPFFPQIIIIIIIIYHFQIFLCNYDPPHHHPLYQITHPPTYTLIHTFQSSHSTLEWWSDATYLFSKWRWLPGCPPNNFHLIIFWRQRRNTAAYLPTVHSLWPWFARAGNVTLHVCAMHTSRTVQEIFLLTLFFLFIFFTLGKKKTKEKRKKTGGMRHGSSCEKCENEKKKKDNYKSASWQTPGHLNSTLSPCERQRQIVKRPVC